MCKLCQEMGSALMEPDKPAMASPRHPRRRDLKKEECMWAGRRAGSDFWAFRCESSRFCRHLSMLNLDKSGQGGTALGFVEMNPQSGREAEDAEFGTRN